ncbi:FHA domain-containing protein [Actinophytocola sp.]|uniref:FHA domain-containing protein n=1 Tax=Actinophytocola sp. TaxID=1872138 RepID=UPI003D6AEEAD
MTWLLCTRATGCTSSDGTRSTHELTTGGITVGRATPDGAPDLLLAPDPHRLVSRLHCVIEYVHGSWTLTDNEVISPTFSWVGGVRNG